MWKSFWDTYKSAVHDNESLSDIDKFTYLQSLVSRSAKDAIDGLPLTADNYSEAVTIFISKHMETLLGVEAVHSSSDIGSLRRMYDRVEYHICGLRSLGITSQSYGALLAPVLQNKLPSDLRLIINRELTEEWDLDKFMKTLATELEVRERSAAIGKHESSSKQIPNRRGHSTTTSLVTGSQSINCVYCQQNHASAQCRSVTEVETRRHILKSTGRCFLCLKRGHITRNCQSDFSCTKCKGMHNTSLCYKRKVTFNESLGIAHQESILKQAHLPTNQASILKRLSLKTHIPTPHFLQVVIWKYYSKQLKLLSIIPQARIRELLLNLYWMVAVTGHM